MRSGAFNELFLGFLLSNPGGGRGAEAGCVWGGEPDGACSSQPQGSPIFSSCPGQELVPGGGAKGGVGAVGSGPSQGRWPGAWDSAFAFSLGFRLQPLLSAVLGSKPLLNKAWKRRVAQRCAL